MEVSALDGKSFRKVDFLVDSGAFLTVLPEKEWKAIKLKSKGEQSFSLADGRVIKRKVGYALIRYGKHEGPCKVVLGEVDDSPLLGVTALEALGLVLDPLKRKLYEPQMML